MLSFPQRAYNQVYPWHTLKVGESFTVSRSKQRAVRTSARAQGIKVETTLDAKKNVLVVKKICDLNVYYVPIGSNQIRVQAANENEATKLALELVGN